MNRLHQTSLSAAARRTAAAFCLFSLLGLSACAGRQKTAADYIGIDAAKEAALKSAGLSGDQVSFSQAGLDSRNGTFFYDIDFSSQEASYQYAIDALTGVVIEEAMTEKSRQADDGAAAAVPESSSPAASSSLISSEQAAAIVLERVPGADPAAVSLHQEEDDGRTVYEGQLVYDGMEYEFTIDAYSGSVIEWDAEQLEHSLPRS